MASGIAARANRLAIDGGDPVRVAPLPWELPGAHYIGAEERALIDAVVDARSPFRFYGLDLQGMVDTLERECARRSATGTPSAYRPGARPFQSLSRHSGSVRATRCFYQAFYG